MNKNPACRNCVYFSDPGNATGKCRINPPETITEGADFGDGIWPTVWAYHWCGRWSQRQGTVVEGYEPIPLEDSEE